MTTKTLATPRTLAGFGEQVSAMDSLPMWMALWSTLLALAWLLPNHYYPWIAFHSDAWVAWVILLGAIAVGSRIRQQADWHWLPCICIAVAGLPLLQYAGGLLVFAGQAWISAAYVFGFGLSMLVGAYADRARPDAGIDALFAAIGIASLMSVGMQLCQWLSIEGRGWILIVPDSRPFANLGQPNQLGTLLLWGLVSLGWGVHRRKISGPIATLAAMFFLFGVALTQSRTAISAAALLLGAVFLWRRLWVSTWMVWVCAGLLAFLIASVMVLEPISRALLLEKSYSAVDRIGGADVRWDILKLFAHALSEKPWLGYGFTTLAPAQLAVAESHPGLDGIFQQSHNLVLDILLWIGIPLGLLVCAALFIWFFRQASRVDSAQIALLMMFIGVIGWHALLELPLHYAYFLLPTGLVAGTVNARARDGVVFRSPRWVLLALLLAGAALLSAITRDYLLIEADFQALRFERAYNMPPPKEAPSILVLTQLQEFNNVARTRAGGKMSSEEIERLRRTADAFPSPSNLYLHTVALALNGRPAEAQARMRKMARIMSQGTYEAMGNVWAQQGTAQPLLAQLEWLKWNDSTMPGAAGVP